MLRLPLIYFLATVPVAGGFSISQKKKDASTHSSASTNKKFQALLNDDLCVRDPKKAGKLKFKVMLQNSKQFEIREKKFAGDPTKKSPLTSTSCYHNMFNVIDLSKHGNDLTKYIKEGIHTVKGDYLRLARLDKPELLLYNDGDVYAKSVLDKHASKWNGRLHNPDTRPEKFYYIDNSTKHMLPLTNFAQGPGWTGKDNTEKYDIPNSVIHATKAEIYVMTPLSSEQLNTLERTLNADRQIASEEAYARADEDLCEPTLHQGVASGEVHLASHNLTVEGTSSAGNCSQYKWKKAQACNKLTVTYKKSGLLYLGKTYYIDLNLKGDNHIINRHGEVSGSGSNSPKYYYLDTDFNLVLLKHIRSKAGKNEPYTIDNCKAIYRVEVLSGKEREKQQELLEAAAELKEKQKQELEKQAAEEQTSKGGADADEKVPTITVTPKDTGGAFRMGALGVLLAATSAVFALLA